jgi:glycosyltransferase involved in cell wall biosynthesis
MFPMRIMLISGEFPPMQGGVGDYTREMARAFTALGHVVWVLVPEALRAEYANQRHGEEWHVLAAIRDWRWGCWAQVRSAMAAVRPDVVDIQYQAAVYDMRSLAINLLPWRLLRSPGPTPVVVTFHDLKPPYLFPKAGPMRAVAIRLLARYSKAAILTNGEDWATARAWPFFQEPGGARRPWFYRIPIGSNIPVVPPPGFDRTAWRAGLGYSPEDFVWAYFGFLNESKGGEILVSALAASPVTTHLLMVGGQTGSSDPTNRTYLDRVEQRIQELGLGERVQWTGYVCAQEVSAALLSADAVIMPYRDGVSFRRGSLHAALAHGCAIVSTRPRVPLPELVDGENIVLVPPDDPQALSLAAQRLHDDSRLRERIGRGAGMLSRQFVWSEIAIRTVEQVFEPALCHSDRPV